MPKTGARVEGVLTARGISGRRFMLAATSTFYIHIPSKLTHDSQFPFSDGDELMISVDVSSSKIIIEKADDRKSSQDERRALERVHA